MKKKILVTGGSGFVGTNLLKRLSAENNFYYIRAILKIKNLKKSLTLNISK